MDVRQAHIRWRLPSQSSTEGRIELAEAARKYAEISGLCQESAERRLFGLIEAKKLDAVRVPLGPDRRGRQRVGDRVWVLAHQAGTICGAAQPPSTDMQLISKLAEEFGRSFPTILNWVRLETHPVLDRAVNVWTAHNGNQHASRQDIATIDKVLKQPTHFRFPKNPGVFLSDEVFKHDDEDRLFVTGCHIAKHRTQFGLPPHALYQDSNRNKLDLLRVVFPPRRSDNGGRWYRDVFPLDRLGSLRNWRAGKTEDGFWLESNKLWRDSEGIWYSTAYLALPQLLDLPHRTICSLTRHDSYGIFTRFKPVPRERSGFGGAAEVTVIHSSEVHPLLEGGQNRAEAIGEAICRAESGAAADAVIGQAAPRPADAPSTNGSPARIVRGFDGEFIVDGKRKPLRASQRDVIAALFASDGLTKDLLETNSTRADARGILKRLIEDDADWRAVVIMPGVNAAGGYRLKK